MDDTEQTNTAANDVGQAQDASSDQAQQASQEASQHAEASANAAAVMSIPSQKGEPMYQTRDPVLSWPEPDSVKFVDDVPRALPIAEPPPRPEPPQVPPDHQPLLDHLMEEIAVLREELRAVGVRVGL